MDNTNQSLERTKDNLPDGLLKDLLTKIIEDKELQGYDLSGSEIVKLLNSKLDNVDDSLNKIEDTEITVLLEGIKEILKEFNETRDFIINKELRNTVNMEGFLEIKEYMKDKNSNKESIAILYAKYMIASETIYNQITANTIQIDYCKLFQENDAITQFVKLLGYGFAKNTNFMDKETQKLIQAKGPIYVAEEKIRQHQIARRCFDKWCKKVWQKREEPHNNGIV